MHVRMEGADVLVSPGLRRHVAPMRAGGDAARVELARGSDGVREGIAVLPRHRRAARDGDRGLLVARPVDDDRDPAGGYFPSFDWICWACCRWASIAGRTFTI